jgi:hypothetical protein
LLKIKNLNFNISENNIRSVQAAQVVGYCVQAYSIDERAVNTVMEQSLCRKSSSSSSNPKVGQYPLVCLLHRRCCFFFFFFFFPVFSSLLTDSVATKTS